MSRREPTRALVLEENAQWRTALAGLISRLLGPRTEVTVAPDANAAEKSLDAQPVDLLCLDLNLSEARSGENLDDPLLCDTGRLQMIELAARKGWASAVILITRSDQQDQSRFIACDESKLNEATVSPEEFVRRRFGERSLVLHRSPRWDVNTGLLHFEEILRRRLPDLLKPGYRMRFGGTNHAPRVTITDGAKLTLALEGVDAKFLLALASCHRSAEFLSDRSVLQIYRGQHADELEVSEVTRLAQREIDGLRRRLRSNGADDRLIIARVRKSARATDHSDNAIGAWQLRGSVRVNGLASVSARARGGDEMMAKIIES